MTEEYTQEEVCKVTAALKDPKFRDLFKEYVDEISDPKHRQEYETYLSQLEAKGEVPRGRKLVRAKPGVCLKTFLLFKSGQRQKLFLNICQTLEISEIKIESKSGGSQVQLPHVVSPPRPDKDSKGSTCLTCDIGVAPKTLMLCMRNPQILKILVDMVADSLTAQFFKNNEEVSRDFKILKSTLCKGGTPLPMSVATDVLETDVSLETVSEENADVVTPADLQKMKNQATKGDKETEKKSGETEFVEELPQPGYRVVEIEDLEISSFSEGAERSKIPKALKVIFSLPGVARASEISLDVKETESAETEIVFIAPTINYETRVPLRFKINKDGISAKFDKSKSTLTVQVPIAGPVPIETAVAEPVSSNETAVAAPVSSNETAVAAPVSSNETVVEEQIRAELPPVCDDIPDELPLLVPFEPQAPPVTAESEPANDGPADETANETVKETVKETVNETVKETVKGTVKETELPCPKSPLSTETCEIVSTSQNRENIRVVISTISRSAILADSWELRSNRAEIFLSFLTANFARHKIHFFLPRNRTVDTRQMHTTVDDLEISLIARKTDSGQWAEVVDLGRNSALEGDFKLTETVVSETETVSVEEDSETIYANLESFCHSIPQMNTWAFRLV